MLTKFIKNEEGFTIVELIAVLGMLAILLFFATPNYIDSNKKANELNVKNNIMVLESKTKEMLKINKDEVASWEEIKDEEALLGALYTKDGELEGWEPSENERPYLKIPTNITKETLMELPEGFLFINKNGEVYHATE